MCSVRSCKPTDTFFSNNILLVHFMLLRGNVCLSSLHFSILVLKIFILFSGGFEVQTRWPYSNPMHEPQRTLEGAPLSPKRGQGSRHRGQAPAAVNNAVVRQCLQFYAASSHAGRTWYPPCSTGGGGSQDWRSFQVYPC